jgi:hypothetical protein
VTARSPAAERLHQARRAAAKELKLKISDHRVIRLATLQAAYDQVQAQLAAGKIIDVDNMLKIDAALAEVRASTLVELPKLEIAFVRPIHEHCRKCGKSQEFVCRSCGQTETVDDDANKPPPKPAAAKPLPSELAQPSASDNVVRCAASMTRGMRQ